MSILFFYIKDHRNPDLDTDRVTFNPSDISNLLPDGRRF